MGDYLTPVKANKDQRRVVSAYLANGGNKVEAYVSVHGHADWPQSKKNTAAKKYFQTVTVKALLKEADADVRLKLEKKAMDGYETALTKFSITKERILEELAKIAFAQQTDVASWGPDGVVIKPSDEIGDAAAAVSEVSSGKEGVKVKLLDKQQALLNLGRELGMFQQKVDVSGKVGVAAIAKFVIEGR